MLLLIFLFAAILGFPQGKAIEGKSASVAYRQYVDPAEHAFADMVPEGWRVGGRMVRYGPVTIAPFEQAMRPDGAVFIQLGDWHVKDYSDLPGWKQGSIYTPGTSVNLIRRTESAEQYARDVRAWISSAGWAVVKRRSRAQEESRTRRESPVSRRLGSRRSEAHFTCAEKAESLTPRRSWRRRNSSGCR